MGSFSNSFLEAFCTHLKKPEAGGNIMKILFLILLFSFFISAQEPVSEHIQQTLEEAHQLYEEGNIQEARRLYEQAAQEEDPFAAYTLGMMYKNGNGIEPDAKKAFEYLNQSADQDFSPAQFELGISYEFNQGVPRTRERRNVQVDVDMNSGYVVHDHFYDPYLYPYSSVYYPYYRSYRYHSPFYYRRYRRSYRNPYYWRGYSYYSTPILLHSTNISVNTTAVRGDSEQKKNSRKAFDYYFKSAFQGNADALFTLGEVYNENRLDLFSQIEAPRLRMQAVAMWEIAARKGHPLAQQRVGKAYLDGEIVNRDLIQAYRWTALFSTHNFSQQEEQIFSQGDEDVFFISLQEQAEENLKLIRDQLSSEDFIEAQKLINQDLKALSF